MKKKTRLVAFEDSRNGNYEFRYIFLGVVANVQKYTKSYATVARGTTRESAGNYFCWKSLSEKHKSLKTLPSENRERGERPMRAT